MSKKIWIAAFILSGAVVVGPALVRSEATRPTTAPAPTPAAAPAPVPSPNSLAVLNSVEVGVLEVRANQAFDRGQYILALPMYQNVAERYKGSPEKLGPVQEKIRVCQKSLADAAAAAAAAPQPVVAFSAEQRTPHPAPQKGQTLELEIKQLGNFNYDAQKGGNIPDDVKRLDGVTLRTRGFMMPLDQADSITDFALVPSLFSCCFGQPPQVQHTIVVHCPKGKAISYYPDELTVEGTLTVKEIKDDDGYILDIFEMQARSVRPAPK
jgi:hypothetical protein